MAFAVAFAAATKRCAAHNNFGFDGLRFRVAVDGDALILPVFVNGERYLFLVDTGSTWNILDRTFQDNLGDPLEDTTAVTPGGPKPVQLFKAPPATLGGRPLSWISEVVCTDLSRFRAVSGYEIYGVIGMQFLRHHIIRIDFDSGEIAFLASVREEAGVCVPLTLSPESLPVVSVSIDGIKDRTFIIDTGGIGTSGGEIESRQLSHLVDIGAATPDGTVLTTSFGNKSTKRIEAHINAMELGGFRHRDVLFTASSINALGTGYLSRYVVTFDFPGRRIYLAPGARFDEPSRRNLSGVHITRTAKGTVVESVDVGSAAALAGIVGGDVIDRIDSRIVNSISLFQVRQIFTNSGKHSLSVKRGNERLKVILSLEDNPHGPGKGDKSEWHQIKR